jgi:O-antigen/teichoic acid export membrane protein
MNENTGEPKTQELSNMAKGGAIGLFGILTNAVLTFLFQIILARSLGPAQVGNLSLGILLSTIAAMFALFGIQNGLIRYVAYSMGRGDRSRAAGSILSALRITVVGIIAFCSISFFGANALAQYILRKPELALILRVLSLSIPFLAFTMLASAVIQAFKRIASLYLVQNLVLFLDILAALVVIKFLSKSALGVSYAILIVSAFGAVIAASLAWRLYPLDQTDVEKPILVTRELLNFSWPLLLAGVLVRINNQTETLVLGALATSDQVGIYTTALKVSLVIGVSLQAIDIIFAPMIADLFARNPSEVEGLYQTATRWAFTLSYPVFLVLSLCSRQVMAIFGTPFIPGAPVVRWLAVAQLVFIITGPSGYLLIMSGHPKMNMINNTLNLFISLALDFILIPHYGALGAAIAGAITLGLVNILRMVEVYFILHIHPYRWNYLKPVLAGLIATAITFGLQPKIGDLYFLWQLLLSGFILGCVYLLGLLIFGFEKEDRATFLAVRQRLKWLNFPPQ